MVRPRVSPCLGFPVRASIHVRLLPRLTPPSSNRTCGFPASGSPRCFAAELIELSHSTAPSSFGRASVSRQSNHSVAGDSAPSGTLPLLRSTHPARLLGSTIITRFFATMSRSDSRRPAGVPLCFPTCRSLLEGRLPGRASQVPRPIYPRAPTPITPESPAGAITCCFPADIRLHPIWEAGHSRQCNEAESSSRDFGSRVCLARLRTNGITPARARAATCTNRRFTWRPPFRSQDRPGLAWRTRGHRGAGGGKREAGCWRLEPGRGWSDLTERPQRSYWGGCPIQPLTSRL